MGLVLQLVETGADARGRGIDVLEIDRPGNLGDIASLGLTLLEAKQLLARVQQAFVAVQVRDHAALRPECSGCGARCHVKDWQSRQVATLFGTVAMRLPRFRCPGCGRSEAGTSWPAHCRSTPELDQLQAHLSALMAYRVATGVLAHLLPVAAGTSHETLRGRTLKRGEQLRRAAARTPEPAMAAAAPASAITLSLEGLSSDWGTTPPPPSAALNRELARIAGRSRIQVCHWRRHSGPAAAGRLRAGTSASAATWPCAC